MKFAVGWRITCSSSDDVSDSESEPVAKNLLIFENYGSKSEKQNTTNMKYGNSFKLTQMKCTIPRCTKNVESERHPGKLLASTVIKYRYGGIGSLASRERGCDAVMLINNITPRHAAV